MFGNNLKHWRAAQIIMDIPDNCRMLWSSIWNGPSILYMHFEYIITETFTT